MNKYSIISILILLSTMLISGCLNQNSKSTTDFPSVTEHTINTPLPTTSPQSLESTVIPTTTLPITSTTTKYSEVMNNQSVILNKHDTIAISEFKKYDFKDMGYEFLYPDTKLRVTVKSEKPVMAYCVAWETSIGLQAEDFIPHYEVGISKLQWGRNDPVMYMEKVSEGTKDFTIEQLGHYVFVIDARWMQYQEGYSNVQPFNYEITISILELPSRNKIVNTR